MQFISLIGHTQELLGIILKSDRPADSVIDSFFRSHKYLGSHDRRFIAETIYGTLRYFRKCEFILSSALREIKDELFEEDKLLLLIVTCLFIEEKESETLTRTISERLKSKQLAKQASKILLGLSKSMIVSAESLVEKIGVEFSFPDWMVERFLEEYGEQETRQLCASLNEQAPLTLRVNTLKAGVKQCQEKLSKQGIETTRTSFSPFGLKITKRINVFSLNAFREGWFEIQDEGSQLLPLLIDPKPNAKVLDVCAGAGGKTLEFAALMKNRGEIYATDINGFRLDELRKRARRAGAQNIRVQEIQAVEDLAMRYEAFFDIVFIDAPCSGLGTIRRNPGMKWVVTEQTVNELSEKQKVILHSSATLVKARGRLVYATCTMLQQENEKVIEGFLANHPEFIVIQAKELLKNLSVGVLSSDAYIKFLPHIHGTDGFFCVVLEKKGAR